MRRPSNVKMLTAEEKVQYLLRNAHLLGDKLLNKLSANKTKEKDNSKIDDDIIEKSEQLRKQNKSSSNVMDSILKSELNILDDAVSSRLRNKCNLITNNNNNKVTNKNNLKRKSFGKKSESDVSSNKKAKKCKKKEGKKDNNENQNSETATIDDALAFSLNKFQCDDCQKIFNNKSSLRRHIYIHLNVKPHKCNHCKKSFRQKGNLKVHMRRCHSDLYQIPYNCKLCDNSFYFKENLDLHFITHVKEEIDNYKCLFCDEVFSQHLQLTKHEKKHLKAGRFQCTLCTKNYDCRSRLAAHIKSHLKIKDYICHYCGKEFLRPNSLRRHVQVCHGGQRVQCPICKKKLKGHLSEHIRTHENARPHKCPDCGQCFTQSTQLTVHRRSHTGARPYPCKICGRPFSHSNALMLHIRRHTGEKPFSCALCPMAFSQLPHMKGHMRKIHGQHNPYKCPKCGDFLKMKIDLDNHMKECKVGVKKLSFEEEIQASIQVEEIDSAMSISKMRFLLALLVTIIASKEKLRSLAK